MIDTSDRADAMTCVTGKSERNWRWREALSCALGFLGGLAASSDAQVIGTTRIVSGLARPVFVTAPAGDNSRIFIVEQRSGSTGRIRIVNIPSNTLNTTAFLSVTSVATQSEQGLLGLAFHPDFMSNGYFYIYYTRGSDGATIIARYRTTTGNGLATTADPASAFTVMTFAQPQNNHNGGWVAFGPDRNLYIATGDGGNFNDTGTGHSTGGNAQDITANRWGKLLRIDVDGPDNIPGNADDIDNTLGLSYRIPSGNPFNGVNGDLEIWAYGLRNPWRPSFDRLTGDLWIADVGQDQFEEINAISGTMAGVNYGWRCMEGRNCTLLSGCTCNAAGLYLPLHTYNHTGGRCSITGGYVYRGAALPSLQGAYLFGDYCSGQLWTLRRGSDYQSVSELREVTCQLDPPGTQTIDNPVSFGEDNAGEMYICDLTGGEVFKIIDISATTQDCDGNGIPDSCGRCIADYNGDGGIDGSDVGAFFVQWSDGDACADVNADGGVDGPDVESFFALWTSGSCI